MVKTQVSSKGQTTIPAKFRARWNSSEVLWEELPDGSAQVRPLPDIMSLLGSAKSPLPRDLDEKEKSRAGWSAGSGK
jgi:bifunctional DNA-binding transcriptional regulator/antitoxin component of YhaV-PrlF toxin-antitoxin module